MKDLVKLLIKLSVFVLIIYSMIFSVFMLNEYEMGIVKDVNNGQIITSFKNRYNFIWQGGMPWKYSVEKISLKNSAIIDVVVQIPSLSSLTDDIYFIKIPLNISYHIKKDNLPEISNLTSRKSMDQYISVIAADICRSFLIDDIDPGYDRNRLIQDHKKMNDAILAETKKRLNDLGIETEKLDFILPGYYPDSRLYDAGLIRNREMMDLDFKNKKEEILLKKQLIKERSEYELYFEKLLKVSSLIKENPNILKYIYIDKLGENIKVIISSDKTGFPAMFGDSADTTNSGVKGDMDNLR